MRILMVLTSHDRLGETGEKTGFWLEELAAPYYVLRDAGAAVSLASPRGGEPPLDPKSSAPDFQTDATRRFASDSAARQDLATTLPLAQVRADDFDAVFFPGGHGPLWDLAVDPAVRGLIEAFVAQGKPVAAVCHASAVLQAATTPTGEPLVAGRRVTGFSNSEEEAVGLTEVVPFLVEERLKALGARYTAAEDWQPLVLVDGPLITGQNPASSEPAARALLERLQAGMAGQA
ncbi:type 1 glutamine amidotransferase domain-containing protein [Cyanobium sp. NIES-981]|uniref:type 1 glutamine amidotransferase domain-containing protein n=1 Tax=Cyanobium sp. NIES-981 TaxID=1851505 RepID=UPI0007DD8F1E|nr:type 1 glutamine amidotransferase domain-containing protein [Cyanobium sp. NIES-981]SBO42882.1 Transcriptional regulator, Fis family [Cyanobium sp. NIES-981]